MSGKKKRWICPVCREREGKLCRVCGKNEAYAGNGGCCAPR